ncbi:MULTISPECIES: ATP-binding protein [unclassified Carboxylicivirga]|uniref:ATP-binding protein n=1 Tax=Carboxylicivirga TaxID=1628153 RepID=UPI003D34F2E9
MSVKIAIASGKGGTGKTTVSLNLFHHLKTQATASVQLIDCDVEEPNDALFLKGYKKQSEEAIHQMIPHIDTSQCTFCRQCVEYCEFNAIVVLPTANFAEVNKSLCHSCGACTYACPVPEAIIEEAHPIAQLSCYGNCEHTSLVEGRLNIGSPMQTLAIKELLKSHHVNADIQLLDAPPGTSCPVVATVTQADYTILVTEPSPFGLHDLKLMVALMRELQQPFGVIINKYEDNFKALDDYLAAEKIEVLGKIPFSSNYAHQYARGALLDDIPDTITTAYQAIITHLQSKLLQYA